jgi:hypothetical protein
MTRPSESSTVPGSSIRNGSPFGFVAKIVFFAGRQVRPSSSESQFVTHRPNGPPWDDPA